MADRRVVKMTVKDNRFVAEEVFGYVDEANVAFSTRLPVEDGLLKRESFSVVFYDMGDAEEAHAIVEDRYDEIIDVLGSLPDTSPDFMRAMQANSRGDMMRKLGEHVVAHDCYTEAIIFDPNNTDYYYNRGNTRIILNNPHGAISDFSVVINSNGYDADAYLNRGLAKKQIGDYGGARADYEKVIELFALGIESQQGSPIADVLVNLGNVERLVGNAKEAMKWYNAALNLSPEFYKAYFNRATLHAEHNSYQEAIRDFEQYLKLGGGRKDGDQHEVEMAITELKRRFNSNNQPKS